uniref:glucan 1,3-beta-glucosidase n=1 Tax=Cyberlindnera saturnus TaxID=907340 RepID=C3VMY4_CYBSA|nr:exo-beta-1,3-glucanase [Cyberlindnera saturnus]
MKLLSLLTLALGALSSPIPSQGGAQIYKRSFNYQTDKLRGVNIGGWLVLEPYITPSLFEVFGDNIPVDEYHYHQYLGAELAQSRLQQHWGSWITEQDFESIKGTGLNFVRIPIGYWAFQKLDSDPYVQGQVEYLDKAIQWARNSGLYVWIDLHGAPGSQNGFDNSGLRDSYEFQNGNNTQITLDVLQQIFDKYGSSDYDDVIIGLELLNEPLGPVLDMAKLNEFWETAYWNLRNSNSTQTVVIHDAFTASGYFNDKFQLNQGYWGLVIDHHHYQVFSQQEVQRSIDEHVEVACQWGKDSKGENLWNLCGEWSAALTDCAKWLNGVGKGARYDQTFGNSQYTGSCTNSQDISTWSSDVKANYRRYIEAQLDAFEQRGGWVFWCWKTENAGEWDFQKLAYNGVFPQPLDDRQYPNQCGF